ncbi:hypothetical protein RA307_09975 [Xanthobacteraceae bacterium Astr-EGSB]|uniref:hypothetical protein n=1 Tax=Astrobacterium formosum TaxID=3069710 RepID=UPI0027B04809|nr:hypothetical protein [Xanthobacteraceae bacterium Astr-EGSB]
MSERDIKLIGALAMASATSAASPAVRVITDAAGGVDCFVPVRGPVQDETASCAPLDAAGMAAIEGRDAVARDDDGGVS